MTFNFDAFYFPPGATAPAAEIGLINLWQSAPDFLTPLLGSLDIFFHWNQPPLAHKVCRDQLPWTPPRRHKPSIRHHFDLLLVGMTVRRHELTWLIHLADAAYDLGLRVALISCKGMLDYTWFDTHRGQHVSLIDLALGSATNADDSQTVFNLLNALLDNTGVCLAPQSQAALDQGLTIHNQCHRLWQNIDAKRVFCLNNWACAHVALAKLARASGAWVTALQHSTVGCPATYAPVHANELLCFGNVSAQIYARLQQSYSTPVKFSPIGRIWDRNSTQSEAAGKEILFIDQECQWAANYYGCGPAFETLRESAETLIVLDPAIRIRVRLHPDNHHNSLWHSMARRYPTQITLTFSDRPLTDDISRSSLAVGLFSTALTTCARQGLPTLFIWEPDWYYTPDLAPFMQNLRVTPSKLPITVCELVNNTQMRQSLAQQSLKTAREYYSDEPTAYEILIN